jgi:hypothetical protein
LDEKHDEEEDHQECQDTAAKTIYSVNPSSMTEIAKMKTSESSNPWKNSKEITVPERPQVIGHFTYPFIPSANISKLRGQC